MPTTPVAPAVRRLPDPRSDHRRDLGRRRRGPSAGPTGRPPGASGGRCGRGHPGDPRAVVDADGRPGQRRVDAPRAPHRDRPGPGHHEDVLDQPLDRGRARWPGPGRGQGQLDLGERCRSQRSQQGLDAGAGIRQVDLVLLVLVTAYPGNRVYRWGCAGSNNVYLFGHAHSVFKPLHDAYVRGRLAKGMKVYYADANGKVIDVRRLAGGRSPRRTRAPGPTPAQSTPEPDPADLRRRPQPVPADRPPRKVG